MADRDNLNVDDYMPDMDFEDMGRMDMHMMQCPMMQCPMMNYMGSPMYMQSPMYNVGHHKWNLQDIYEDDDSDYSSDDKEDYYYKGMGKEGHGWCPHPYYKKK